MRTWFSSLLSLIAIIILYILHFTHSTMMESAIVSTLLFLFIVAQILWLARREIRIKEQSLKRLEEVQSLDLSAKLLVRRDLELNATNQELDKKIEELERSEQSLLAAFRKLEAEKDKTLAIVSNFTDPILVLDSSRKISLFNPAAQKILGVRISDLETQIAGEDDFNLNNFKGVIRRDFIFKKINNTNKTKNLVEEINIVIDNQNFIFKVMTEKIVGKDQKYLGTMKIFYDLTREKMIDKMKSEFISIAAHQLRTPLSAIKWVIQMALDEDVGKLNAEQKELLNKGFKSNERMIRLVNDLLDVSRIEDGRFDYNFQESSFEEIIENVVENLERFIAKNHLKFTLEKPEQLPKIFMDKERITLVLQNLLDNAVKYTPEYGSVGMKVGIEGNFLRVSIQDNGVGIPKEDQVKLFSKFFRASNVVRMETEGTGLGLFIVKNIVEKHGGQVAIHSEEGKGTEVTFTLLLKKSNSG